MSGTERQDARAMCSEMLSTFSVNHEHSLGESDFKPRPER